LLDATRTIEENDMRSKRIVVQLAGAKLSYPSAEGEVSVLNGIDLEVEAGEIIGVMGPSGSGKSSLIALIAGLEAATGGQVTVVGTDLSKTSEAERTRLRRLEIGVVFQSFHLVPAMTALQNASLSLMLGGAVDAEKAGREILERVGLGHRLSHKPSALSGGEQQRVAIARAFAPSPRLILADEPTGNLDQETGNAVVETMFDLVRHTGASMLMVTHDRNLAQRCDRIVEIDAGRIRS
jgi:putative ABC transport system ATP-binding protein